MKDYPDHVVMSIDNAPFCNQHDEDVVHVLFTCSFSRVVWMIILGGPCIPTRNDISIADIFEHWMNIDRQHNMPKGRLTTAMIVSWSIWNERCEVKFQQKQAVPQKVASKAMNFAVYIKQLNEKTEQNSVVAYKKTSHLHWKPPASPFYVINCDASYDAASGPTRIALILRDFAGNWWGCSTKCYAGIRSSEQAECLAFYQAVKWSKELQHTHIVLETDLKGTESYINNSAPVIAWENEDILLDAIECLKNIPQWECHFVPRNCNKPVDKLAKHNWKNGVTREWFDKPPSIIESLLLADNVSFLNQ
ncbi:uncharacterized protein LOC113315769 [Papaver somniferum]|uniref:uncharacterized protein LOC113315769 n=1 Tax=Papaver somniferum TaxID=3469 RepID=UPI000E6F6283|nr:uncharacterized protein LOC113315769 [Papaver somniferum]